MSEQPKEYCEHWVVCKHAHALLYCPVDATGKHHKECEYDTRSRPYPAPEHEDWARTMHVDQDSIDPPQPTIIPCSRPHPAPTDEQCRICSEATERKAREDVLDEITKYINEMYPLPGPEGDYLYPSRKGRREVYEQMRVLIESLLAQQQGGVSE
jgi:hypothetical protein